MIQPVLKDDQFLADVKGAQKNQDVFHLWWLGQSGFLIRWQCHHLLIDPYLSDSLTRKYAGTDKPHVRMTARVVAPDRLDFIEVISSSHNHSDHLDAETVVPIMRKNPAAQMIVPSANRDFAAQRLGISADALLGIDDSLMVHVGPFRFIGVASAHEEIQRDEQGRCRFLGYVIRFGCWTVYHSGDTVDYDGLAERLRGYNVTVALLPINGRSRARRVAGNLTGPEAAALAKSMGAGLVIPCHYEMFQFNTASPDEFVAEAERLRQPHKLLRCGERWTVDEGIEGLRD